MRRFWFLVIFIKTEFQSHKFSMSLPDIYICSAFMVSNFGFILMVIQFEADTLMFFFQFLVLFNLSGTGIILSDF